ncbi:hypothetical protein Bpfe_019764 [Biomphalaria pfeifferi]|uniref:UPAR/Ly6 domain-containing protein n=1 Tax=Biomphalaria pfeifferi TaxID=112525 RepID=A0AAD8BBB0_BIOPF|nr:hypothetical protein Bpfe_019764 [Biomphalaria pfeifferi]
MRALITILLLFLRDAAEGEGHKSIIPCYNCDGHVNRFPECLSTTRYCHADEVCSITYLIAEPIIKCHKDNDCIKEMSHAYGFCEGGGILMHNGACLQCCNTAACLGQMCDVIKNSHNIMSTNQNTVSTTMSSTSTTVPTTSVHTASIGTSLATIGESLTKDSSVRCMSCFGEDCKTTLDLDMCHSGFCKNFVYYTTSGLLVEKGCATKEQCDLMWTLQPDSTQLSCILALNSQHTITSFTTLLTCHYCCHTDMCNLHNLTSSSLYHPSR